MDLLTAVAISMLPVSRLKAAAVFKEPQSIPVSASRSWSWSLDGLGVPAPMVARPLAQSAIEAALAGASRSGLRGMTVIPLFDPRYPALLACTDDPPPVLWAARMPGGR